YWTFRIVKFDSAQKKYNIIWEDYFADIRSGSGYFNGVACGSLDSVKGDEIALTIFPNLYIFNVANNKTNMLYQSDYSNSNTSIIADFNNDGINELGYNRGDSTIFIQYTSNQNSLKSPQNLVLKQLIFYKDKVI
ncbi:MAG: hypothetical protein WCJ61_09985, partial [Paludibacter sp.]